MRKTLAAKRALPRRIIALVAAYSIALASLIASFNAAQAAAAASRSDVVICHSIADQQTPASDQSDSKVCADCCIGCIPSIGAAVAPNVPAIVIPTVVSLWVHPLAHSLLLISAAGKAHRSRGPPPVL